MTLHLPTLLFASITIMATSAALMTVFGLTQRIYRGYWCWTAAQWLSTVGLALQLLRESHPGVLPVSNLLLLQAPMLLLLGIRRFYPRHELQLPVLADALLFAAAYLAWAAAWAAGAGVGLRVTAFAAGSCLLHVYSAALVSRLREFARSTALRALVATQLVTALVQLLRAVQPHMDAVPWLASDELMLASGLVGMLLALVLVYVAMLLTYERTERKLHQSQRQLRFLADTDTLTEVPNRRRFYELATKTLALCAPGKAAIVMFDIDHFKQINDRFGHAEGDEALREVARCTRETLRAHDVAGRIGGDEFALLLPETTVAEAFAVASRVAQRLEVAQQAAQTGLQLSLSVGVVLARKGENIADALRRADQALYEAKRQGRSRAVAAYASAAGTIFTESQRMGLGA
ncbi:MAG: GGDEF domain-containing protein [Ideonella sp.]|nr:GGDEF domain-containing protein [Ideonella sp.]